MSWRQQKHECLYFHYWDFLTKFWCNNWRCRKTLPMFKNSKNSCFETPNFLHCHFYLTKGLCFFTNFSSLSLFQECLMKKKGLKQSVVKAMNNFTCSVFCWPNSTYLWHFFHSFLDRNVLFWKEMFYSLDKLKPNTYKTKN